MGTYIDTSGEEYKLLNIVFEALQALRVGQKVIIEDVKASNIYVVKLEDVEKLVDGTVESLLHACEMTDQVTEPAHVGSIEFVKHAKCSAGGNPLELNRQDAMIGLETMASLAVLSLASGDVIELEHELHRSIITAYVGPKKYSFYFHKGRLCQHLFYFEKTFYGFFKKSTTESINWEEHDVDQIRMFEEWLYLGKFGYPKNSDDSSLLLVKVFCFANKVGLSDLQNATLDVIRDRAVEQHVSPPTQNRTSRTFSQPQGLFGSTQGPIWGMPQHDALTTSPGSEEPVEKPLPPATVSAIKYAYKKTLENSPLRKLLTDIFAYDVKPDTLDEDILSFPNEFVADVLLANMKRLPSRLDKEEADFDKNAERYHIHNSSSTPGDRNQSTSEDAEAKGTNSSGKGKKKGKRLT